jgi:hypothetical protein
MSVNRSTHVALVVLLLLTLSTSAASAAPSIHGPRPVRRVDSMGIGGFAGGGGRYVVWTASQRTIRIFDAQKQRAATVLSSCSPMSGSGATFLLFCGPNHPPGWFSLLNARRRTITPVAGSTHPDGFQEIGRYWLKQSSEPFVVRYMNWHTGERVEVDATADQAAPRDLDTPDLAPVTGLAFSDNPNDDPYVPDNGVFFFGRANGYSLLTPLAGPERGTVYASFEGRPIALDRRCIWACGGDVAPLQGPMASWSAPPSTTGGDWLARTRRLGSTRTYTFHVRGFPPDLSPPDQVVRVARTRGRLFLQVATKATLWDYGGGSYPSRFAIYETTP